MTSTKITDFYDQAYFDRQARDGLIQGKANVFMFEEFIRPTDNVLDFGCGGGFLLAAITAKARIGVEINPVGWVYGKAKLQTVTPTNIL